MNEECNVHQNSKHWLREPSTRSASKSRWKVGRSFQQKALSEFPFANAFNSLVSHMILFHPITTISHPVKQGCVLKFFFGNIQRLCLPSCVTLDGFIRRDIRRAGTSRHFDGSSWTSAWLRIIQQSLEVQCQLSPRKWLILREAE